MNEITVVREPEGDHQGRQFADIFLDGESVGALFCSPEQLEVVSSVLTSYNHREEM